MRFCILTSFTSDYKLGYRTSPINRRYAECQGYGFVCRVHKPADASGRHPQWDKVELLVELLTKLLSGARADCPADTTHLLWLDADAVVIKHSVRLADVWEGLPSTIQLVIGEDVTTACLINTGVLCVRVTEWSLKLWQNVWSAESSERYHRRRYHEQSALVRQPELHQLASQGPSPRIVHLSLNRSSNWRISMKASISCQRRSILIKEAGLSSRCSHMWPSYLVTRSTPTRAT